MTPDWAAIRAGDEQARCAFIEAALPLVTLTRLRVVPNPHLAVRAAAEALAPQHALCVTGSVYLAGIARRVLGEGGPAAGIAVSCAPGSGPRAGG